MMGIGGSVSVYTDIMRLIKTKKTATCFIETFAKKSKVKNARYTMHHIVTRWADGRNDETSYRRYYVTHNDFFNDFLKIKILKNKDNLEFLEKDCSLKNGDFYKKRAYRLSYHDDRSTDDDDDGGEQEIITQYLYHNGDRYKKRVMDTRNDDGDAVAIIYGYTSAGGDRVDRVVVSYDYDREEGNVIFYNLFIKKEKKFYKKIEIKKIQERYKTEFFSRFFNLNFRNFFKIKELENTDAAYPYT